MTETNLTFEQEMALFEKFKTMMLKEEKKKHVYHRRSRGTGSIVKLSGNRKKPFVVNVTIGRDEDTGRQIKKCLGTFKSREDAETALSAYNLQRKGLIPNTLPELKIEEKNETPTFAEIWEKVWNEDIIKLSASSQVNYKTAFSHLKKFYDYKISKITLKDLQPFFDLEFKNGAGTAKLNNMKIVCKKIFTYAMKYDFCDKDYSLYISFGKQKEVRVVHTPYTHEEISKSWKCDNTVAKLTLIYIYTGLRPIELISIDFDNIHLNESYMIGGVKTSSGKNRIIPLHRDILPFVKDFKEGTISFNGTRPHDKYENFRTLFKNLMNHLKMKHNLYDARHTFATLCNEFELNDYLVKKMMGHSCKDLTKDVYTHASIERLVNEVNKLPGKNEYNKPL